MRPRIFKTFVAAALTALAAGCGGGSSATGPVSQSSADSSPTSTAQRPSSVQTLFPTTKNGSGKSVSYGPVPVGQSGAPVSYQLQSPMPSTGSGSVTVTNIAISNPAFSVVDDHCSGASLPPGGSCGISIEFTPSAPGAATADLTIETSQPDLTFKATLSGEGIASSPSSSTGSANGSTSVSSPGQPSSSASASPSGQ